MFMARWIMSVLFLGGYPDLRGSLQYLWPYLEVGTN